MGDKESSITKTDKDLPEGMQRYDYTNLPPSQVKSIAMAMAISGMFPDVQKDSAKAFVKILAGQEMGIAPFQAMSDISIIQGKAAAGGNIYASKLKGHPKYDYKVTYWERDGCKIEFYQDVNGKRETIGVSAFMEEDAKSAGLLSKDNWKKWPRNMYFNRAITAGVRTFAPDALGGINAYVPEEFGATVDEEGRLVVDSPAPQPQKPRRVSVDAEIADKKEVETTEASTKSEPKSNERPPVTNISLIGEELIAKGFEDPDDRKKIALYVADVSKPSELNEEEWGDVLSSIREMDTETLSKIIMPNLPEEEEGGDEIIEELGKVPVKKNADGTTEMPDNFLAGSDEEEEQPPKYVIPEFKEPSSNMPSPPQRKYLKPMWEVIGLTEKSQIESFTQGQIGKKAPTTFIEMNHLIEVVTNEANVLAAAQ